MRTFALAGIIFFFLFLCSAGSSFAANFEDGYQARAELQYQVLDRIGKHEFASLEKQADEMRRGRSRFTDGGFKLNAFFQQSFGNMMKYRRTTDADSDFLKTIDALSVWCKSNPSSINARLALAWTWYGYAWFARSSGYVGSVSDKNMQLFQDRLERAYDLAKKPVGVGKDCPERYNLLLRIARIQGWDDEKYERLYQEAVSHYPDYYEYVLDKAVRLQPRWHGAPGEWTRFAEESMKRAPAGEGKILYAWIVSNIQKSDEIQTFKTSGVSWPLLRDGFRDMNRNYPGSIWNTNRFALHACLAEDRETIRELLGNPDFIYQPQAWPGVEIDSCRVSAGLPTMQEIAKTQMERNLRKLQELIFKEMLTKAENGSRQSMAVVGEMYARGDGVQKDDAKAYAWLVLSGENKELLNEVTARLAPASKNEGQREMERLRKMLPKENKPVRKEK